MGSLLVPYTEPFMVLKGTIQGSNLKALWEPFKVPRARYRTFKGSPILGISGTFFFRVQELGFHIRDNEEPF